MARKIRNEPAGPKAGDPAATWERVDSLEPWTRNPRISHDIEGIARSITDLGFAAPIVAREGSRVIVLGHGRWEAMRRLGREVMPVRWMVLTDDEATQLALADNRLSQSGEDDESALVELLREVDGAPGFDESEWARVDSELRAALEEPEWTPVKDEFWVVIRGPLSRQVEVMEVVDALECESASGVIRQ